MNGLRSMKRKYEKCVESFDREIWKDDNILAESIVMLKFIFKEQMRGGGLDSADLE